MALWRSVERYVAVLVVSLLGFLALNVCYGVLFPGCIDCHAHVGVPFAHLDAGGFEGGGGLMWWGVLADSVIVLATAVALVRAFQHLLSHKPSWSGEAVYCAFLAKPRFWRFVSGATAFLPFWTYLVESDAVELLRRAGRTAYIHIPISAGEMLNDTLLGFKTLAASAKDRILVVWINEYFGPVSRDGKTFNQMQV
ncbi:MAG TPA: hypothetical protein VKT49_16605 [Bryobacteraceae bacterium]|nr:hypothetical protein [Bryobacteraceae bacterium]